MLKIEIEIDPQRIADIMITAIESGDPVTTARKGGWCYGIYQTGWNARQEPSADGPWYSLGAFYDSDAFQIEVLEVADENKYARGEGLIGSNENIRANLNNGCLVSHILRREQLAAGLARVATISDVFSRFMSDEGQADAADADTFLQLLVLGEVRYG